MKKQEIIERVNELVNERKNLVREREELLERENLPITEISDRSGFSTIRTFNRAFLKRYGISPSQYKKEIQKQP